MALKRMDIMVDHVELFSVASFGMSPMPVWRLLVSDGGGEADSMCTIWWFEEQDSSGHAKILVLQI